MNQEELLLNLEDKMRKHVKPIKIFISLLTTVMCAVCLCSCTGNNPNRITELYFVACTDPWNCVYMNEDKLGSRWQPLLKQDVAVELAHEVEAIPDTVSTEGVCSYVIKINYVEDGVEKHVEKTGYNTFPDNWERVVDLTNKVTQEYTSITDSRELAVIDAEYLRSHKMLDYVSIPRDVNLDDIIEGANITYFTLYDPVALSTPASNVERAVEDYLYDYYDLRSHQIEKIDENPAKSSTEAMKEFAYSRLDDVYWTDDTKYYCGGSYNGEIFTIIRYDCVDLWLADEAKYYDRCGFSGPHCQYQTEYHWEAFASAWDYWDVFVDGSGKFLILTKCEMPDAIAHVVE